MYHASCDHSGHKSEIMMHKNEIIMSKTAHRSSLKISQREEQKGEGGLETQ